MNGATSVFFRSQLLHQDLVGDFKRIGKRGNARQYRPQIQAAFPWEIAVGAGRVNDRFRSGRNLLGGITEMNEMEPFPREVAEIFQAGA